MALLDSIGSEVELFYRSYIESFNRGDAAAMLPYLAVPFVMVSGAKATGFDDEKAVVGLYDSMCVGMRADNWTHSTVEVTLAGAHGAILIVTEARIRADGSESTRGKACYSLQLYPDGNWRVAAIIADFQGDSSAIK